MNLGNLLRRVRFRGLVEGKVQRARVEALEGDARDDAEHWHDYGFTARPMDGGRVDLQRRALAPQCPRADP